ncbi:diguanylate cyclase [uncultured Aquabacterium sp.]|uniref:diguanylate cyclase domain-containing protein n=1 Tax=Aquabacterium sp. TaxID=1872578 RepID=UPI0025E0D9AE|nr:diguanylate cyclase [uncultured Aquabacterium sp.]
MFFRRITSSIVTRLVLFGLALALTGSAIRYQVLPAFLHDQVGQVVAGQQAALATYVAQDIAAKLDDRERALQRLAAAAPWHALHDAETMQNWLATQHRTQPFFVAGMAVVAPDGHTLAQVQTTSPPLTLDRSGDRVALPEWVDTALRGSSALGRPLRSPQTGEVLLPMTAPVRDTLGQVRAVLIAATELGAPGFLQPLEQARLGTEGSFLLITPRDRLIIAATDPALVLHPAPATGQVPLYDQAAVGYRGGAVIREPGGEEMVTGVAPVPGAGWIVVARVPATEALAAVAEARRFVSVQAAVTVGVFLLLASVGLYLVFRPLLRTAALADRMSRGELPLASLPVLRDDEVGHLTKAFNRLLRRLLDTQNELARMAHHDPLTSLPNRVLLADRMALALARARRNHTRLAVLFMDLDGFKPVNDRFGHEAGDRALIEVARRLDRVVRETDTLARVGGDEFALVLGDLGPTSTDAELAARAVANKCMNALATPIRINGQDGSLGLSIGIALGDGDSSLDALMSAADSAMYQAKEAGRGRFVVHEEEATPLIPTGTRRTG